MLWKERNACIFQRSAETVPTVTSRITDKIGLWKLFGAVGLKEI
jgi:hypothetical protein